MRRFTILLLVAALPLGMAFAAGFSIGEFGGRAAAMGNAVTAQAYDASTLFYNPAGLGFLEGTQFYGNVTLIDPSAKFVGADPFFDATVYDAKEQIFPPVGLYATYRISEKWATGISLTTPFGLGLAWEDDFPGTPISKDAELQTFYLTPLAAYQINPNLSVALGPDVVFSSLTLIRDVIVFDTPGVPSTGTKELVEAKLEGSGEVAFGFATGIMYRQEKFGLGFMYRHSITVKADDGEATFKIDPTYAGLLGTVLTDQTVKAELGIPNYFVAGLYYMFTEKFGVEFDYAWYGWSIFDEIVLEFDDPTLNQTIPEGYKDEYQLRLGAHYDINEKFSLRAGFIYDRTPQPIESVSPLLPDDTRTDWTIGAGYKTGNFVIDGGYMWVNIGERSTVENGEGMNDNGFDGTYNSHAHLIYLGLGYTIK